MLHAHESARNSDTTLSRQLSDQHVVELLRIIGLSKSEIHDLLPAVSASPSFDTGKFDTTIFFFLLLIIISFPNNKACDTSKLEGLLVSIAELFEARNKVVESVEQNRDLSATTDALLDQFNAQQLLSPEAGEEAISRHLSLLDPYRQDIEKSIEQQSNLLRKVNIFL